MIGRFLADVARTTAVHLMASAAAQTVQESAKTGTDKAKRLYREYQNKKAAERAVDVTPKTSAIDAMRDLKRD